MICISLTTSPRRIHFLRETLVSIFKQTVLPDLVVINVPHVFKRTGETYTIPDYLKLDPLIYIHRCDDIGPATKILPTVDVIRDNDATLISIDDDMQYCSTFIETMVQLSNKNPGYAITGSSFLYDKQARCDNQTTYYPADFVEGFAGVLYKRKFLVDWQLDVDIAALPASCVQADDFILSNMLKKRNIPVIYVPLVDSCIKPLAYGFDADALHKLTTADPLPRYSACASYLDQKNQLFIRNFMVGVKERNDEKIMRSMIFALLIAVALCSLFSWKLAAKPTNIPNQRLE